MDGIISISGKKDHELKELGNGIYEIELKKGEEAILFQNNEEPDFIIEPMAMERDQINYFGVK
jgi:hypothetical protein